MHKVSGLADEETTHETEKTLGGLRLIFLRVRASGADIPASEHVGDTNLTQTQTVAAPHIQTRKSFPIRDRIHLKLPRPCVQHHQVR